MDDNTTQQQNQKIRNAIAQTIIYGGVIILLAISVTAIIVGSVEGEGLETAKSILNTLLPVIGTWVGTVIAYYFGKENFEAASRQMNTIVERLTPDQLKAVPVKQVMIDLQTMSTCTTEKDINTVTLGDVSKCFASSNKRRLPVISSIQVPMYILHKDELDRLIKDQTDGNTQPDAQQTGSALQQTLASYKKYGHNQPKGFALIPLSATISDAKNAMKKVEGCDDVFITENGQPGEKLLGWLTEDKILDFLNVG